MNMTKKIVILSLIVLLVFPYGANAAAYKGEVSAWVPWFAGDAAAKDARKQLSDIDTLYLFTYEIKDGKIVEKVDMDGTHWKRLIRDAGKKRVEVIPTIAWFDGDAIHEMLSSKKKRQAFVRDIAEFVDDNDYDGVDIDFEQKKSETIDYFSLFLEELNDELGRRQDLVCTIEARMEPEHRWRNVPSKIQYANDYEQINKHCDTIQIMAYDQQRADIVINEKRRGVPYAPVADVEWVEHVLEFALEDFDADKVVLGVPTYGRAWDVTVAPDWYRDYKSVASLNQPRILELSKKYDAAIGRSEGGEPVMSYFPEDSIYKILNSLPVPADTKKGYEAAAKALFFATRTGMEVPVRFVTWSDADAIGDKIELAEKYDLKGVAIFKADGEEDPDIWQLF